jgi:hypothetical protein
MHAEHADVLILVGFIGVNRRASAVKGFCFYGWHD